MKEVVGIIFDVSMLIFVAGSMIALGLKLTIKQIIEPFKNIKMVILALTVNFLIVPFFAFGIVQMFHVSEGVRTGIILLSLGGGAPFIPKIVEIAGGYVAGAIGLMLLLLIVTIILMPIVTPLIFSGTSVSSWGIAKPLILVMLFPLVFALFCKAYFPDIAARIQPFVEKLTNVSVLSLLVAVLVLYTEIIILNASMLPVVLLFFLGAMLVGYGIGGGRRDVRFILLVGTGLRNPPVAMLVASQNFSAEPMAAIVPLLVIVIGLSILFPLAIMLGKGGVSMYKLFQVPERLVTISQGAPAN